MRIVCAALFCAALHAQPAELSGSVSDPSGSRVPRAALELRQGDTGSRYSAATDLRGEFHFLGLPPGEYRLTVDANGFKQYVQSGILLILGGRADLAVRLELAAGGDTVEVRAAAPLLETASGAVSFAVDQSRVNSIPLDGRNFIPLVALSPGVALPGGGSVLPRINGGRPRTNEYLYDGLSVLQPEPGQVVFYPIIDGIAEFRVNLNSYTAEYGRSNGGTIMVATKSGGNDFHGTLFEFLRNEDLNARNYFAPPAPAPSSGVTSSEQPRADQSRKTALSFSPIGKARAN